MKYEEMIKELKSYRMDLQNKYKEDFYDALDKGIREFGWVYVYPEHYHHGIYAKKYDAFYGIDIKTKYWLFIEPLLRNDFNIEKMSEHAFRITLK